MTSMTLILVLIVCTVIKDIVALRNVRITVPQAVVRGKDAVLECSFDLEGENLYSVKWYRGGYEFYRYTPRELEPIKLFQLKGIKVRQSESRDTKIVLEHVSREISGPFSCEVTADQPSFFTDMQTAELQVVDLPKRDPYITGLKKRYTLEDDTFQANCTSESSYPAANITWHINGLQIREPQIRKKTITDGRVITTVSTIRHKLLKKLFNNRRMKLRCSASLYNVYHKSTEVGVELWEKRKHKSHSGDWPTSTTATPPPIFELEEYEEYENTAEKPPENPTLWFFSPSSGCRLNSLNILSVLLVSILLLRR